MRLHRDAKVDLIEGVPLFSACSKRELQRIAGMAEETKAVAGDVICEQGTTGTTFFVIVSGTVDIVRNGRKIDTATAGEYFGETSLIARRPRNATVRAATDVVMIAVVDKDFGKLLSEIPLMQLKLLRVLAQRLAPTERV